MITTVMWRRETAPDIYEELMVEIYKADVLTKEAEIIKKRQFKSMQFITSLFFFSVLFSSNEAQMIFIMRHLRIHELLRNLL
jgi:hypothetical protein